SRPSNPGPAFSTTPTPSNPGVAGKVGRTPYRPRTTRRSEGLTGLAIIRTRTSPGPGSGIGTSRTRKTSDGSPNCSQTAAVMEPAPTERRPRAREVRHDNGSADTRIRTVVPLEFRLRPVGNPSRSAEAGTPTCGKI